LIVSNLKSTKNPMKSTYFQILISISRRFNLIFDHWFTQFDFPDWSKSDSGSSNLEFLILVLKLIQSTVTCSKFPDFWFPNSILGRDSNSWFLFQKPPKRKSHLKKPISFFKMGPVNLKNPSYSFSARLTVKDTILDRAFTRLFNFNYPIWKSVIDFWTITWFWVFIFEAGQFIFSIP
jgi:hypothetical protein